jgi:hypothetical protein
MHVKHLPHFLKHMAQTTRDQEILSGINILGRVEGSSHPEMRKYSESIDKVQNIVCSFKAQSY